MNFVYSNSYKSGLNSSHGALKSLKMQQCFRGHFSPSLRLATQPELAEPKTCLSLATTQQSVDRPRRVGLLFV